jgi:hypothetical protein
MQQLRRRTLFLLTLLFWVTRAYAQDFKLININTEQGLSNEAVWCISQDKDGYIWFGTSAGLDRYDGKEFKHFTTKNGLPENEVLEISNDLLNRRMYIETFSNSLCYLLDGKIYNEKNDKSLLQFKGKFTQSKILYDGLDRDNAYVYGDRQNFIVNRSNLQIIKTIKDGFEKNRFPVEHFFKTKDGEFAILKTKQKIHIAKFINNQSFRFVKTINDESKISFKNNYRHHGNTLAFDDKNGIYCFHSSNISFEKICDAKTSISALMIDKDSLLWYGKNDGIWYVDLKQKNQIHHQLLRGIIITNIYEDNCGNIWISTLDKGVYLLDAKLVKSKKIEHKGIVLSTNRIFNFENQFYYGHNHNNYSVLVGDKNLVTYQYDTAKRFNRTIGCLLWKNNNYLISEFGIYHAITRRPLIKLNAIKGAIVLDNKTILVATARTLTKFILDENNVIQSMQDLIYIRVSALARINENEVLFGNLNDLYIYRINNQFIEKLKLPEWCTAIKVNKIILKNKDEAWILTSNLGILIYKNHQLIKLQDKGIFDEQNVKCISYQNKNIVWAGTDNGIYKIGIQKNQILKYEILQESEGLVSKKINDVIILNDSLFIASAGGVNYFNIYNYQQEKTFLIVLNEVLINDSIQYNNKFPHLLKPSENSISISFAGLYYGKTKNLIYFYRLVGANDSWKSTLENTLDFSSLQSNKYTFEVYAVDKNNKAVKSKTITYSFEIEPHFYETKWFYLIVLLCIAVLVILVIRYNNQQQKLKFIAENELNKKMNSLELKALQSQLDPHFIFNSINAIKDFLNRNDTESTDKYLDEFAHLIRNTLDNSRQTSILLSQEMKYLSSYLKLEQLRSNNRFSFSISSDEDISTEVESIPTMMLQPFAENCVRHGKVGALEYTGNIKIHFSLIDEDRIKCSITDNGVGLDVSRIKPSKSNSSMRSHALKIQRERINLYNQTADIKIEFDITNRTDHVSGTVVNITLPILFYENIYNDHH